MYPQTVQTIFNFTFNPYAIFSLTAIIINAVLIYIIARKSLSAPSNRWFILVLVSFLVWGFSEFMGRISATAETFVFWNSVGIAGWMFVGQLYFAFTLTYIGKTEVIGNFFNQIWLFGGSLVFLFLGITTELFQMHNPLHYYQVPWGWYGLPPLFFPLALIWIEGFFFLALYYLLRFNFSTKDIVKKMQTKWFIVATIIPILGGSFTDGLLPVIFSGEIMPTAVILTAVMSIIITYA